jgi:hypothetical protein
MTCQFCGSTCDGNSWDHMQWQFWDPNMMPSVGIIYGFQFFGPHAMAILGSTFHGSSGENIRRQYLNPHAMAVVGTTNGWQFWRTRAISILWSTRDVIAREHIQWKFLGQYGVSFLGTTSYTGVKLKSLPSGVRILNCHTFSYRA